LDMALDDDGRILNNVWTEGRVGIVDIGGNTMNLLAVNGLEEITQLTTSTEFGLLRALDGVRDKLRASFHHFTPETHEVSEWLAAGKFRHSGQNHELWPFAEPYLVPLLNLVQTKLAQTWPESGRFDALLLSGGGAAVLGRYLMARLASQFANPHIVPDPRWANARGYYKLAKRESNA